MINCTIHFLNYIYTVPLLFVPLNALCIDSLTVFALWRSFYVCWWCCIFFSIVCRMFSFVLSSNPFSGDIQHTVDLCAPQVGNATIPYLFSLYGNRDDGELAKYINEHSVMVAQGLVSANAVTDSTRCSYEEKLCGNPIRDTTFPW